MFPWWYLETIAYGIAIVNNLILFLSLFFIFRACKLPAWQGFVPVLNLWVLCRLLKLPEYWTVLLVLPQITGLIQLEKWLPGGAIAAHILLFVATIFQVLMVNTLRRFGKKPWAYTLGLALLPMFFFPHFAFTLGKRRS